MGFMIFCFVVASMWDGITTALGVASVMRANDELGYAMCAVSGLVVLGFSIGTKVIWTRSGAVYVFMRFLWVGAVIFDFYTSFIGNTKYIILRNKIEAGQSLTSLMDREQLWLVIFLTALVSGAPILLGVLSDEVSTTAAPTSSEGA